MRGSLVGVVLLGCWSVALAGTNMRSRIAVPTYTSYMNTFHSLPPLRTLTLFSAHLPLTTIFF